MYNITTLSSAEADAAVTSSQLRITTERTLIDRYLYFRVQTISTEYVCEKKNKNNNNNENVA